MLHTDTSSFSLRQNHIDHVKDTKVTGVKRILMLKLELKFRYKGVNSFINLNTVNIPFEINKITIFATFLGNLVN